MRIPWIAAGFLRILIGTGRSIVVPDCHRAREQIFTRMKNIRTICVITIALALCGCANQLPPPGGPPDKTPPEIVATTPASRTLDFHGESIVLEFSEYVDRNRAQDNIFISPPLKTEYNWSGRELEIEFVEELQPQTTYAVTVGTEYADRSGNKPASSYTLIFSTGDRLDSGLIQGKVESSDPAGAFVFLYPLTGLQADTLNPATTKPKYRTQIGANGTFEFQALPAGSYRLLAVKDEFRNELFDPGIDAFGTTTEDILLPEGAATTVAFRLGPAIDNTPPQLYSVTAVSQRMLRVELSESPDTASIQAASFAVTSEKDGTAIPVLAAWLSPVRRSTAELLLAGTPAAGSWKLTATAVRDSVGNSIADTARTATFTASDVADTTKPALLALPFADSTSGTDPKRSYTMVWSTAVDSESVYNSTRLFRSADTTATAIPFEIRRPDENITELVPRQPLAINTGYVLKVDVAGVRSLLGRTGADTVVRLRFHTTDPGDYGLVSGAVIDSSGTSCPYVIILTSENKKTVFRTVLSAPGTWEFKDVPPGTYTLIAFCDADGNGVYSYGDAFPYRAAERFVPYQQPVVVRPRWTVENVKILFP